MGRYILPGITVFLLIIALTFIASYAGLLHLEFFSPRVQEVKRETFEETQSYVEGKRQQLLKLRHEYYTTKDSTERVALRSMILHSFANVDEDIFEEPELKRFLHEMKYGTP